MLSWLLAYGFFRSLQFTCINTLAYADMPQTRMSQATSFASTTQQLSLSLGVGIGSQLLNTFRTLRDGGALEARDFQTRSEEHTSELQSLMRISYAVFCLKKKKTT